MKKQAKRPRAGRVARSGPREPAVQYTVRNVPAHVDRALRRRAADEGKSLNQLLRDALTTQAVGDGPSPVPHHDLDALAGAWDEDPEFDRALAEQDTVDAAMWR
jgi:plasmid stability protein